LCAIVPMNEWARSYDPPVGEDALPFACGLGANRAAFDIPRDIAYFNTSNLSLQLHAVRKAGEAALRARARPWSITAEDWFTHVELARSLFAELIGADLDGVAMVAATSYGFAVAANNLGLREGKRVLVLAEEYPSGIYTWRRAVRRAGAQLLTVSKEPGRSWTEVILAQLDERVGVVSVPNVHWTDGAVVDLDRVADRAHAVGARLVIDASQSAGAMPLNVRALRADFVITVGYKWLLGPFGLGYLYVAEQHRRGQPLEENWISRAGSQDFARLVDYRDDYQPGSRRFDVGQRTHFELMPMAEAALRQLTTWQVDNIAGALRQVTSQLADGAADLGLSPLPTDERAPHMLGIALRPELRARALTRLADKNCFAAIRGGSLRISPHLHTDQTDIDTLLAALAEAQ
jgi:selenocysteine lyase/cysteine desulfurase